MDGIYHVYPVNDTQEHILICVQNNGLIGCLCNCKPITDKIKNVVIHNSFDGREAVEIANEILNKAKEIKDKQDGNTKRTSIKMQWLRKNT